MMRVLLADDAALLLSVWSGYRLLEQHRLALDESGLSSLQTLLHDTQPVPTDLLIDSAGERHRIEVIPALGRRDRKAMIRSLIERHLGDCAMTASTKLAGARIKTGSVRLSGLSPDHGLAQLFALLHDSGIVPRRLLSTALLAEQAGFVSSRADSGQLLISRQSGHQRRFSYYTGGFLTFSRVLPITIDSCTSITDATIETLNFLQSREQADQLLTTELVLLEAATIAGELKHSFADHGLPTPLCLDPEHLLAEARATIEPELGSGRSDRLFSALAIHRPHLPSSYAHAQLPGANQCRRTARGLWFASAALGLAGVAAAGGLHLDTQDIQARSASLEHSLDAVLRERARKLPEPDARRQDLAAQLDTRLARARALDGGSRPGDLQVTVLVADHLDRHPLVSLKALAWSRETEGLAARDAPDPGADDRTTVSTARARHLMVVLDGELQTPDRDIGTRGRQFAALLSDLESDSNVVSIEILQDPLQQFLQVDTHSTVTDPHGRLPPSRFILRLRLAPAEGDDV